MAILNISDKKNLEQTIQQINKNVKKFNLENANPYSLEFAMGYAVYDIESKMSEDDFFKSIDKLMYDAKRQRYQLHDDID